MYDFSQSFDRLNNNSILAKYFVKKGKQNALHTFYFFKKNIYRIFIPLTKILDKKYAELSCLSNDWNTMVSVKKSKRSCSIDYLLLCHKIRKIRIWKAKSLMISRILTSPSLHWGKYFVDTKESSSKYRKTIFGMGENIYNL